MKKNTNFANKYIIVSMEEKNTEKEGRKNPFFVPYTTPHETVPFDKIRLEDYEEAFLEGIRRDDEQIEKTINNPDEPTFDNTIINVDDDKDGYYDLLSRVSTVFFNLLSAETNDEMDALAQKIQPILTKHANDVRLNKKLFERIKAVHDNHRALTPEEQRLLDNCYDGFVRSGALLNDEDKEKLRRLTEEASMLSLQFSQNLLKENKAFKLNITDEKDLDGLPETAREAAAAAAKENGMEGWVFTLDFPSYSPFMTYSTRRSLRKEMYMQRNKVCTHDNPENNIEICKRIVNLRREIAQLLGFRTYADYVLKNRMASNADNVYKLLNDLIDAYMPTAKEEVADIEKKAKEMEGEDFRMEPWDFSFYSHKLQLERFNLDSEMLRPYLELGKVIDGVFGLANRLYGITFKENKEIPVYHPDVKAYEVFDNDGKYLAVFYADFHPRKGKQGGAWMTEYQGQWIDRKGVNVRPHVSVVMNLTKPTEEKPALLTLGEVETFLHEFGHSLHGMFANTRFESLSGTNVWWDFVELPSQFMENYAIEKEFLRTFAFHYKPQLHGGLRLHETGELRTARHGILHEERAVQRRPDKVREAGMGQGYGTGAVARHLHDGAVQPYHGRRLRRRILQLQMGRGARCGCLQRVQEERYLRQGHGTEIPRLHPLEGRNGAPDDSLQEFQRLRADHRRTVGEKRNPNQELRV